MGYRECACGTKLAMRVWQTGANQGRCDWACAQRAVMCRRCFLWNDGGKELSSTAGDAAQSSASDKNLAPALPGSCFPAGPSMLDRFKKRGLDAAFGQDMSREGVLCVSCRWRSMLVLVPVAVLHLVARPATASETSADQNSVHWREPVLGGNCC